MAEWRYRRGWTEGELLDRLERIGALGLNFQRSPAPMTAAHGWNRYYSEAVIGLEPRGAPVFDGPFERARPVVANFEFSDPRIVTAHFDPAGPLLGRRMLLEIRVLGLRYLNGTVVGAVRSEADGPETLFGYRHDTLEGHIESGSEWFMLVKDHATGEVRFRIEAAWRPGDFPNWWSRLGFAILARRYQLAWHRLAYVRLREIVEARGLRPLPRTGRLIREGPYIPGPRVREMW